MTATSTNRAVESPPDAGGPEPTERRVAGLASRLMTAQALLIAVGAVVLVVTSVIVAPPLFSQHLARTGENSPSVTHHAEAAFASSFAISLAAALTVSLITAGLVSWFLVRRVADPVEQLADAAEAVAGGIYTVEVPQGAFSSELQRLSRSFTHMAGRLADTETTRSRLLADLAHEIRTPLATLEAYIDGLEDGVVVAEPTSYATMRAQVGRLRRLAIDLRETAAADEHALHLSFADIDLAATAAVAVAAADPRYQAKDVSLQLVCGDDPLPVHADEERLQQVLANLLDNALRHTPPGGSVRVSIDRDPGAVVIRVVDSGEGIPPALLPLVFDRFFRVDPARASTDGSGSGLGLTIARAIVNDHGGSLGVSSPGLGRGATFTVRLPA